MNAKRIDPHAIDIDLLKREFEKVRAGLEHVRAQLSDNAQAALEELTTYLNASFSEGGLSTRVAALEDELAALTARLKDGSRDTVDKLTHEVEARPVASLALAFGAGALAMLLLRRG